MVCIRCHGVSRNTLVFSSGELMGLPAVSRIAEPSNEWLEPRPAIDLKKDHIFVWPPFGLRLDIKVFQAALLAWMMCLVFAASARFQFDRLTVERGELLHSRSALRAFFTRRLDSPVRQGRPGSCFKLADAEDFLKWRKFEPLIALVKVEKHSSGSVILLKLLS